MVASTSVPLTKKSQEAFITYYKSLQNLQNITRNEQRARFEVVDRAYQREVDQTQEHARAQAANQAGDTNRFQNMTVPVVLPQVEAAVVHQTSVFLTGDPIFGVVAGPQFIDEALQLESILENQAIRGAWPQDIMKFFRDGFKYNFSALEVAWNEEVTYSVETNLDIDTKRGVPKQVIWSGNNVKHLDVYNVFVDTRVAPTEVYKKGEFAGYTEFKTRIELKQFIAELPDKIIGNIVPAFESGLGASVSSDSGAMNYYIPVINPRVSEEDHKGAGTNWLRWAGISTLRNENIDYKDAYEVTTVYCKVLPSEFNLSVPNRNTPQIYKLIIVNHEHIIYAEQQTNAHNYLPILIGQPLEDGLGYQTKSLADNSKPFQELTSAYMNSIIASRRRAISDRVLYDPSRITSAQINSANPSAKIPVRPAAYGKNIAESVFAFPYREDQAASSMQQIQTILGLSNQLVGQNQAQQGQFVKGNKTLQEFESVMANANGRDQMASILLEYQVFMPMKEILKLNILQFQGGTTVYNRDKDVQVEINPVALRKAVLNFRVTDGLTPAAKVINAESWAVALQTLGSAPQIAGSYNIAPMFSYLMKAQGANISEFEKSPEQVAYEQALANWQSVAEIVAEKGGDIEALPPMPLPEQYGFNPQSTRPAPPDAVTSTSAQTTQPATPTELQ